MALDSDMLWEGECQACGSLACEFCGECRECFCDCEVALIEMDMEEDSTDERL